MRCILHLNVTKCPVKSKHKPLHCNLKVSICGYLLGQDYDCCLCLLEEKEDTL